jgi:putative ABC transport system permease protein
VERILRRLIDLVEKTSLAISALAWISLICGLLVLTSISRQLVYERQKDLTLLKVIGADANYIRTLLLSEVTMISLLGSICGVVLGWGVSQIVAVTVFQSGLVRPSLSIVLIPCVSWCLAMALSWRTMGKIARQKADLTVISED